MKSFPLGVESWVTFNEPTWNLISGYVLVLLEKDLKLLFSAYRYYPIPCKPINYFMKWQKRKIYLLKLVLLKSSMFLNLSKLEPFRLLCSTPSWKVYNWGLLETLKTGHLKNFPTVFNIDKEIKELGRLDFLGVNFYETIYKIYFLSFIKI